MILRVSSQDGQVRDFRLDDEEDVSQLMDIVPEVDEILESNEDLDEAMRQIVMHIQNHGIDAEIIDDSQEDLESDEEVDQDDSEKEPEGGLEAEDFDDEEREEQNSDDPEQEDSPGDEEEAEEEESFEDSSPEDQDQEEESEDEESPKGGQEKQLAIVDAETGEPAVILSQDENGIEVVGGDPRLVEELELDQFQSLEEIADALNSDPNGPYQAVFEGEGDEPQVTQPNQSDTMKACIDIIKDVLAKVKQRQAMEDDRKEAAQAGGKAKVMMGAETIDANPGPIYVAFDGDAIGNAVARAEAKDDEAELSEMSNRINAGQDLFRQWAMRLNGMIVEQGGDEGMAKVPGSAVNQIEEFRAQYAQLVGATVTVGVGEKISQATKARMLGKLKGKNQTLIYDDTTERELQLRLKDVAPDEAQKISQAMTPSGNQPNQPKRI